MEAKPLCTNTAVVTVTFTYKNIITRFECPLEIVSNQGTHFVNAVIEELLVCYQIQDKQSLLPTWQWTSGIHKQNLDQHAQKVYPRE